MKTFQTFLEDTGYQGDVSPTVEPPVHSDEEPISGGTAKVVRDEVDPTPDEVAAIRGVNKQLDDIQLDDLDEALDKVQEILATIGVTFDEESAKSALESSDKVEIPLHDNPTDEAEPIAIYGRDDDGNEEPGELVLCVYKDDDDYKAHLNIYFGEEAMRLSDLSLQDKETEMEEDYEGKMVNQQLRKIHSDVCDLMHKYKFKDDAEFPAWLQKKIDLVDDYVGTIYDYLVHGKNVVAEEEEEGENPEDVIRLDVPAFLKFMEYAREEAANDEALHDVTEKLVAASADGKVVTMKDYEKMMGEKTEEEEESATPTDIDKSEITKKGNVEVYESNKSKSLGQFISEATGDKYVVVYVKNNGELGVALKDHEMDAYHLLDQVKNAKGVVANIPVSQADINKTLTHADDAKKVMKKKLNDLKKKKMAAEEKKKMETEDKGFPGYDQKKPEFHDKDEDELEKDAEKDPAAKSSENALKMQREEEAHLTPAEIKKRDEIIKALEREKIKGIEPGAVATATVLKMREMKEAEDEGIPPENKNMRYDNEYDPLANEEEEEEMKEEDSAKVIGDRLQKAGFKQLRTSSGVNTIYDKGNYRVLMNKFDRGWSILVRTNTDESPAPVRGKGEDALFRELSNRKIMEEDSAKVIGDIVKIASGPLKSGPHGNALHKVIDIQDGKLLIQPWDQETEKTFPLKDIKYPHYSVLVDPQHLTSHDMLGMHVGLKEDEASDEGTGMPERPEEKMKEEKKKSKKQIEDEEEDEEDNIPQPATY